MTDYFPLLRRWLYPYANLVFIEGDEVYDAVDRYLSSREDLFRQANKFRFVTDKSKRNTKTSLKIDETDHDILDLYTLPNGVVVELWWSAHRSSPKHSFKLTFRKHHLDEVRTHYLPEVMKYQDLLYYIIDYGEGGEKWHRTILDHPLKENFEALAIDRDLSRKIQCKLDLLTSSTVKKMCYHIYGPPGVGKTLLILCMAYYLRYNIYELDVECLRKDAVMRRLVSETTANSIVVVNLDDLNTDTQTSLSGLFRFIGGWWNPPGVGRLFVFKSKCRVGHEAIIGKIDMEIPMSYLVPETFKFLVELHTGVRSGELFDVMLGMITEMDVTAGEVVKALTSCRSRTATTDSRLCELAKALNKHRTNANTDRSCEEDAVEGLSDLGAGISISDFRKQPLCMQQG